MLSFQCHHNVTQLVIVGYVSVSSASSNNKGLTLQNLSL